jgi:catechol 2,3-dioxygenase-like lactoylglutathione lyase family enzyme
MSLIPMMRCRDMRASVAFYTTILDFERIDGDDDPAEHDLIMLGRSGHQLAISRDDGLFGTVVLVATPDVDAAFRLFRRRGLRTPGNREAPVQVHEGPIDQTWGTREFYVEDPDGNTLRFTQPWSS